MPRLLPPKSDTNPKIAFVQGFFGSLGLLVLVFIAAVVLLWLLGK